MFTAITPIIISGSPGGPAAFQTFSLVRSAITLGLAVAALVVGILAARRGAQPVLAGIAIGVGGASLVGILAANASTALFSLLH